jgi:TetR/AcrR family transcriptional repressor of nem operon
MGRIREFDVDIALKLAMHLFWRKGYHTTSLEDLCEAMNISRSSFYAAYTDKKTLFISCMNTYFEGFRSALPDVTGLENPIQALRNQYLTVMSDDLPNVYFGCLLVNTVLEMADVDDELKNLAEQKWKSLVEDYSREAFLQAGLSQAEAQLFSKHLDVVIAGITVADRRMMPRSGLRDIINQTFDFFQLALASKKQALYS